MTKELSSDFPPGGQVSLWAYDSVNDKWYAVLGDEDGHLQLDVAASALPTGAATAAKQLANDHDVNVSNMITGFATSAKQLPDGHNVTVDNTDISVTSGADKIEGFAIIVEESLEELNVAITYDDVDGTSVPTGKIWKITHASMRYTGTVPTEIRMICTGLAGNITIKNKLAPASNEQIIWDGEIYMQVGDYIKAAVWGGTAGDDLRCKYAGVQMDAP